MRILTHELHLPAHELPRLSCNRMAGRSPEAFSTLNHSNSMTPTPSVLAASTPTAKLRASIDLGNPIAAC
ncbi:MAG: hypothetical protein WCC39_16380, partial [Telluria sp.]